MQKTKIYKVAHLFCGLGGGALGFKKSRANHKGIGARFETLVGIDNDPEACEDFRRLTRARAVCADIATMTLEQYREACAEIAPDVIFTSPPCKGMSGLISNDLAETEKYQAMNRLIFQGLFVALEAFHQKPKLILLENVERIRSRDQGKALLRQVRELLMRYGYVFHEGVHDCGELGGLSQRRRRFLLIARHEMQVPTFVYQPQSKPVRTIGECLEKLPLPDDPSGGPMHRLPKLNLLTLVRLALIPAGKDWRALGTKDKSKRYNNVCRIVPWDEPSVTVTAGGTPSAGGINVADPRFKSEYRNDVYKVVRWEEPSGTVTGEARASTGGFSVADPRFGASQGQHYGKYRVEPWHAPAHTITGSDRVGSGALSVADPRFRSESRPNLYGVMRWDEPAKTVTGSASVSGSNGAAAVADPRFGCTMRGGHYGVQAWDKPAVTVTGSADVHAGAAAVADPRKPKAPKNPVIISEDGTWHRPLTTLELAALQSLPVKRLMKTPLAGKAHGRWRERIGNAVPPDAAEAMGSSVLKALLSAAAGDTFVLGSGSIWVRRATLQQLEARP